MRCLAVVLLCLASISAQARPSPYPPVTPFSGDRYVAQAQMGADVARAVKAKTGAKPRYLYPTRKRPPVTRQRWRHVPVPMPRPVTTGEYRVDAGPYDSDPGATQRVLPPSNASITVFEGVKREAGRVAVQIVGGRPSGCPSRFCACALALKIFGRIMPGLNVAVTWAHKFPRAAPAPTMVAARHGHAFQLIAHVRGDVWRVWDANSGHGRTRIHERSIAGFVIVNPHGSG